MAQTGSWGQQQQQQQAAGGWGQQQAGGATTKDCTLIVTGCTHATVGGIVRGSFQLAGENHGKPAYKKDGQVNGLDVMTYYWDERDGPSFCGWWFGPKVGGDQVWAYHPDKNSTMPPQSGWKVPYDGPVDTTFQIQYKPQKGNQQQAQQMHQQGWQQQQQQLDANRKAHEEANRKRLEEQKAKMDQMKQQQQAMAAKRAEEEKKRAEEMAAKKLEQVAVLAIRRAMQTFRASTPEKFDENKKALDEAVAQEMDKAGSQKERLATEIEQAIEATKTRIEQIAEARKKEEERKAQENEKRKEMKVKAEGLLVELEKLVAKCEEAGKGVAEEADPLFGEKELKIQEIEASATAVEEASKEATEIFKAATDFVLKESGNIKNVQPITGEPVPTCAADLNKLVERLTEAKKVHAATLSKCQQSKASRLKRANAKEKYEAKMASFKKFDADKDGKLNRKEIQAYSKADRGFTLPASTLDSIFDHLVMDGSKGVDKDHFHRMKIMIGIAQETQIDGKRKAAREAREKEVAAIKEKLQEKVKDTADLITAATESVAKAEEQVKPLTPAESKDKKAAEMLSQVDEVDAVIEKTKASVTKAKEAITALSTDEAELKGFLAGEIKKLEQQWKPLEGRLSRSTATSAKYRTDAAKKNGVELEKLRADGLAMIFQHQGDKKLMGEDVYKEFDKKSKGSIDESAFVKFFKTCSLKEDVERLSEDDSSRLFNYLDSEETGAIAKEDFLNLIRKFMKVVKASVLTDEISIKSNPLRRLAEGEVLEILTGPTKESEDAEIARLKVKAMSDDKEGWVTPCGNQGTVYLVDGGNIFKVVKETILTGSFIIGENTKVKDRKLKVGETVEVREWAKKEEASGLMRMKVRVQSDGQIGWATSVGNTGITFLQCV